MALSPWDPRWDPFREMTSMRRMMDRLWEPWGQMEAGTPALDVSETDDEYTIQASVPGVRPEDVKLTVDNNVVTIAGECCSEEQGRKEGERILRQERRHGSFSRSVSLPSAIDAERANASFEDGCLRLTLPKSAAAKPRQIPIGRPREATEGEQLHREGVAVPNEGVAQQP